MTPAIFRKGPGLQPPQPPREAEGSEDVASVSDALECLLAVGSGGPEGRTVVLESGGVAAAAAALQMAGQEGAAAAGGGAPMLASMAVCLLGRLLGGPDRADIIAGMAPIMTFAQRFWWGW